MERFLGNPIIKPEMVKPSHINFRVKGVFNPGAVMFNDEILLLVRVAEDCIANEGLISVPLVDFEDGHPKPAILTLSKNDPQVILRDTRGIMYKGIEYLSTMSHIRIARSSNGTDFKVDSNPFIFPSEPYEQMGIEDVRVTAIDGKYYINYTSVSVDGWSTSLAVTEDFESVKKIGYDFPA